MSAIAPAGGPSSPLTLVNGWPATSSIDDSLVLTKFIAETLLPTRHGIFRLRGYKHSVDGGVTFSEPTAMVYGSVEGMEHVPVRVHDACFTSEVMGSLKCDCAEQLTLGLSIIRTQGPGIVIYLQQEGRGIGLANKIAAYSLQEQGLDTVDANRALGLPDDCREYSSVRNILLGLRVQSVRLITNNPRKMSVLTSLGIEVTGRIPCVVAAGEFNQGYLDAKRDRMSHMLSDDEEETGPNNSMGASGGGGSSSGSSSSSPAEGQLNGEFCYWNHEGDNLIAPGPVSSAPGGMGLPGGVALDDDGKVALSSLASRDE
ncbi:MAG: hypothetical protein WDW36_007337 [Sanguina aurantia]